MECPYCKEEMINGELVGDGRMRVRFHKEGEKINLTDKAFSEKGCINAKYSLTQFKISACYCDKCKKLIIDTDIKEC